MRALAQVCLCLLMAGFVTVLAVAAMAASPIGFIGLPLTLLLFVAFFCVALHWLRVEWGY